MRLQGIIIDARYKKGISESTGNPYELTNYTLQHTDEQGHNHLLVFTLSGQKMYDEKVHKGDHVEVSVQLGVRESQNGNKFNTVNGVYYVGRVGQVGVTAQPRAAQMTAPQPIQPSQPVFAPAPAAVAPTPAPAAPAQQEGELPF